MAKKEYRALVGMNYPHPDSTEDNPQEVRVEAGDKITILPDDKWVSKMENQRLIEEWEDRNTENVRDHSEEVVSITGVVSRHRDGVIVLKQVGSED